MNLTERIKAHAIELGFDLVGIAPAGSATLTCSADDDGVVIGDAHIVALRVGA